MVDEYSNTLINMEIRNITAVMDFNCKFNLPELFAKLPHAVKGPRRSRYHTPPPQREIDARYNPEGTTAKPRKKFPGLTLRITKPVKATAHIFSSGKIVCLGIVFLDVFARFVFIFFRNKIIVGNKGSSKKIY